MEPTSGLEPLTCSLRVIGHVLQGVAGLANPVYLSRFLFSGLLRVAPYCAPSGIRVVSISPVNSPDTVAHRRPISASV